MQTEIIEQIITLADLRTNRNYRKTFSGVCAKNCAKKTREEKELSIEERKAIVESLRGIATSKAKLRRLMKKIREDYHKLFGGEI